MSEFTGCSFAYPGTYGHECGRPATLVAQRKTDLTKDGVYWARRCPECAEIKGGENTGLGPFIPYDKATHINHWK